MKICCVDLDGTFIQSDMLYESFCYCFFKNPFIVFCCVYWLLIGGKVKLKAELASRYNFDPLTICKNKAVIEQIIRIRTENGKTYLVSASDESIVKKFYLSYSDLFDDYFATTDGVNLSSKNKASFLTQKFGIHGFEYIGNSNDDIAVWNACSYAYCVNKDRSLFNKITVPKQFLLDNSNTADGSKTKPKRKLALIVKQLRCYQWAKNSLLFVPAVTAHELLSFSSYLTLLVAFLGFSVITSAVYVVNDLIDLDNDRSHATKCKRPLASSALSIPMGFALLFGCLIIGGMLACLVSFKFLLLTLIYLVANFAYSVKLKKIYILDCIALALMYSYRIFLGNEVVYLDISVWLMSFSLFFFLALAFTKRYSELFKAKREQKDSIKGRGFIVADMPLVMSMAVGSGFLSLLIFDLYLNDEHIKSMFTSVWFVYFCIPILLYWLARIFLQSGRGQIHEDPVIFALKDKGSLTLGIIFVALYLLGSII